MALGCRTEPEFEAGMVPSGFGGGVPVIATGRVVAPATATATPPELYLESGQTVSLVGAMTEEIRRLSGARITVLGIPRPAAALDARTYAVLEVNGERPQVGVVTRRESGYALFLESGIVDIEAGSGAPLESMLGAKIWTLGPMAGEKLRIQSYGMIRPR